MATAKKQKETIKENVLLSESTQTTEPIENVLSDDKLSNTKSEESAPLEKVVIPDKSELSNEQKIINFIDSRIDNVIKLNDFLKSLFGVPKFNEPPQWLKRDNNKYIRTLLSTMQSEGKLQLVDNRYLQLGQFYHKGDEQKTFHYNLNDVEILAKK